MRTSGRMRHLRAGIAGGGALMMLSLNALPANDRSMALEEIIVTATKRAESMQSVPMSMQALSENTLAERRITDVSALAASVPGLSLADGGPGYRTLYVRGVVSAAGNASTTGVYLDEVFVPPGGVGQTVIEPLYFDMERVEVLRGPQGTLFGGSSMGGTVRFLTRQADPAAFAASVGSELSFTKRGGSNYEVNGLANLPLVSDVAAVRIVGSHRDRDGFVDKLVGDFSDPQRQGTGSYTRYRDVNDERFSGARIQGVWHATDRLEIRPMFLYQKSEVAGLGAIDNPPGRLEQRRGVYVGEPVEDEFKLANLVLDYQADAFQVLSSTSHSERDARFKEDASDIFEETFVPEVLGGPRGLFFATTFDGTRADRWFQQELRVSSTREGSVDWLAGLYYERLDRDSSLGWIVPGFSSQVFPVPDDNFYIGLTWAQRTQKAVFAEASWHVTDRLTATLGLRWYEFDIETQNHGRDGLLNGGPLPDAPVLGSKEDGTSPRFSLAYDFGDQLLYVSVAKGFRPGGPNAAIPGVAVGSTCVAEYRAAGFDVSDTGEVPPYESDELWNYELGAKGVWAQGRFVVNGALYRMEWDDLQQGYLAPCGFGSTQNFGKARIEGVEIDYRLALTAALELSGGVSYNDAALSEDVPQLGVEKGLRIQNTPEWSGNISARYGFAWRQGTAYVSSTLRYVDDTLPSGDRTDRRKAQHSYTTLGARVGFARGSWRASLFGDNLTDRTPSVFHFASTFLDTASHTRMFALRGRTVGVDFRKDF